MARIPRAEKKRIQKKRKSLRKSLRKSGITSRREFEKIAFEQGLSLYDDGKPPLLAFWWSLLDRLAGLSLLAWLLLLLGAMLITFFYSTTSNQNGRFIVTLSDDLFQNQFELSETEDFEVPAIRCQSNALQEVSPYSLVDMPDNLDRQEGSHNLDDVVAFTFWVRNNGDHTAAYDWHCIQTNSTKGLENAVWIMIFDEGKASVYAISGNDGEPETVMGIEKTPYRDEMSMDQYIDVDPAESLYGIETIPFENIEDDLVASGFNVELAPGETHKYTAVIWVEGYDSQCTEEIIGGHAGYAISLVAAGDEDIYGNIRHDTGEDKESESLIDSIKALFQK